MNTSLILKNDGHIYVCRPSEEPKYPGNYVSVLDQQEYEAAKEKAIKEAILCADQEQAKQLATGYSGYKSCCKSLEQCYCMKVDTPYIIPGLDFEVKTNSCEWDECKLEDKCQHHPCYISQVAILILPKQEEEEQNPELLQWLIGERNLLQNTSSLMLPGDDRNRAVKMAEHLDKTIQYVQLSIKEGNLKA